MTDEAKAALRRLYLAVESGWPGGVTMATAELKKGVKKLIKAGLAVPSGGNARRPNERNTYKITPAGIAAAKELFPS